MVSDCLHHLIDERQWPVIRSIVNLPEIPFLSQSTGTPANTTLNENSLSTNLSEIRTAGGYFE